jgi:hypothetical protein
MTLRARIPYLGSLGALLLAAGSVAAQESASDKKSSADPKLDRTSATTEIVSPAPDSSPEAKPAKKKGGLFGKVKGLAGNKTVQQVAKTAACTMVPGGQAIAGAIDAASSKDVGKAVEGAAGVASGGTCMPAGFGDPPTGGSGVVGAVTQAAAAKAAVGRGGVVGYGAMPGMPDGAMGLGSMEGMPGQEAIAECLGMSAEEYLDFVDPTRGEPRQMTKAEMKRQATLAKKVDMRRYQACMMQQGSVEQ